MTRSGARCFEFLIRNLFLCVFIALRDTIFPQNSSLVSKIGNKSHHPIWAMVIFLLFFMLYSYTLSPDICYYDFGDIVSASHYLGIAHPSGYPQYVTLSRIFHLLPLGSIAYRNSLFTALIGSIAVMLFFILLLSEKLGFYCSLFGAFLLGFSVNVWELCNSAEIYSLALFYVIALLFIYTRMRQGEAGSFRTWLFLCFVAGLFVAHHLMSALAIGAIGFTMIIMKEYHFRLKGFFLGLLYFILGASSYLFVPIRASLDILYNWGKPDTLKSVIYHYLARQYQGRMFELSIFKIKQMLFFGVELLARQWGVLVIILAFLGLLKFACSHRLLKMLLIFSNAVFLLYVIDPSFFIPAYLVLSWLAADAMRGISDLKTVSSNKILGKMLMVGMLLLLLGTGIRSYLIADKRGNYLPSILLRQTFYSLPPGSIVLTSTDDIGFNAWYLTLVERALPSIVHIHKPALSWRGYVDVLRSQYPGLLERLSQINPKNQADTDSALAFLRLVEEAYVGQRAIFIEPDPDGIDPPAHKMLPHGVLYRLAAPEMGDAESAMRRLHILHEMMSASPYFENDRDAKRNIALGYINLGNYYCELNLCHYAESAYRRALEIDPDNEQIYNKLGMMAFQAADMARARAAFSEAIRLSPRFIDARLNLAITYHQTGHLKAAKQLYESILSIEPGHLQALNNLAAIYLQLGDRQRARYHAARALDIDPDYQPAAKLLEELE